MDAHGLLAELRVQGVELRTTATGLAYDAPVGVVTPELLERLRAAKDELIEMLRMAPAEVLAEWRERSSAQRIGNTDLVGWYQANGRSEAELLRACELCAAAGMALEHGDYVHVSIRPHLTKAS